MTKFIPNNITYTTYDKCIRPIHKVTVTRMFGGLVFQTCEMYYTYPNGWWRDWIHISTKRKHHAVQYQWSITLRVFGYESSMSLYDRIP